MTNDLGRKTLSGVYWTGSTKIVTQTLSWVSMLVVARILTPGDFGLMGIAGIFSEFVQYLAEFGAGAVVIQRKEITSEEVDGLFWVAMANSFVLSAVMVIGAPGIGDFFHSPQLAKILRVVAISFVAYPFCTIQYALLSKDMRFDVRSKIDFVVDICAIVMLLSCALLGLGVWSLVVSLMTRSVMTTFMLSRATRYCPSFKVSYATVRPLLKFGMSIVGGRFLYYSYVRLDAVIIGRYCSPPLVGAYTMAMQLATVPVERLTSLLGGIQYAAFAKLQDSPAELRQFFRSFSRAYAVISFPLLGGLIYLANEFVHVVLSDKWQATVVPMQILAIMGLFKSISVQVPFLLNARGKPHLPVRIYLVSFLFLIPGFFIGAEYAGLIGVALAWGCIYPPIALYTIYLGLRATNSTVREFVLNLTPAATSAVVMLAGLAAWSSVTDGVFAEWPQLVCKVLLGAIVYVATLLALFSQSRRDLTYLLGHYPGVLRLFSRGNTA